MNILADTTTVAKINPYYQDWTCAGFILAIFIAIAGAMIKIHTKDNTDLRKLILTLKSQISVLFMKTIIDEAKLLINIIDDHLPYSLSQCGSKNPTTSRFDYFCGAIKSVSLEDLQEDRNKYATIIKDAFSGLLKDEVDKLIRIVSLGPNLNDASFNFTGIRYGLEGETALKFDFIARKMANIEKWHRNYNISGVASKIFFALAEIAALIFMASVVYLNSEAGKAISMLSMGIVFASGIIAFIMICFFFRFEGKLKNEHQKCEDDPGFEKAFAKWKGR